MLMTGSGFLDSRSFNGITVIPLEDKLDNKMVYIKRRDKIYRLMLEIHRHIKIILKIQSKGDQMKTIENFIFH